MSHVQTFSCRRKPPKAQQVVATYVPAYMSTSSGLTPSASCSSFIPILSYGLTCSGIALPKSEAKSDAKMIICRLDDDDAAAVVCRFSRDEDFGAFLVGTVKPDAAHRIFKRITVLMVVVFEGPFILS